MNRVYQTIWLDCRHAIRLYRQTAGMSLMVTLVFAIGMAFFGAFLSLYVDLVFRSSTGFEQSTRIATIQLSDGRAEARLPYGAIKQIADEMASIETAAMLYSRRMLIESASVGSDVALVSDSFFDGLRPRLALGRGLQLSDHASNAEPLVVLSHHYWQQQFEGNRDILGTSLKIEEDPSMLRLSVANSSSGLCRKLKESPAVGLPAVSREIERLARPVFGLCRRSDAAQ